MKWVGAWILEEARQERGEILSRPDVVGTLADYQRCEAEWYEEVAVFTPEVPSLLTIREDGSFTHEEAGNTTFGRYDPSARYVCFEDTRWSGPWRTATIEDVPFDAVLWEVDPDEVFFDRVRVEGEILTRLSFLVWDGLYLTRTTGRYRRARQEAGS